MGRRWAEMGPGWEEDCDLLGRTGGEQGGWEWLGADGGWNAGGTDGVCSGFL